MNAAQSTSQKHARLRTNGAETSLRKRQSPQERRALAGYWLWQLVSKSILGLIYFEVIAEGLRLVVPALGKDVHRIPGLGFLYEYEATHALDLAHFMAFFLMVAVLVLWRRILELWLGANSPFHTADWQAQRHQVLVVTVGVLVLLCDAVLFYLALAELGWSGNHFSFTALIATGAYLGVIVFVSYISIVLRQRVLDCRRWE